MNFGARTCLLRDRKPHEHSKVTFVELFFDLVFVFADHPVVALSARSFPALAGVLQTALMLMAVWWVWVYTSWGDELARSADHARCALLLFALMLAGLRAVRRRSRRRSETRGAQFSPPAYVADAGWPLGPSCYGRCATTMAAITGISSASRPGLRCQRCSGSPAPSPTGTCGSRCGRSHSPSNMPRRPPASGRRVSAVRPPRSGTCPRRAIWPNAAACSSSSRSANRSW